MGTESGTRFRALVGKLRRAPSRAGSAQASRDGLERVGFGCALLLLTQVPLAARQFDLPAGLPPTAAALLAPLHERTLARDPAARLDLAVALHASGFPEAARPLYDAHVASAPEDARGWFLTARCADARGDVELCADALDRAAAEDPTNAELAVWRYLWRHDHGQEVADEEFDALRELGPTQVSLLVAYGRVQLAYENPDPILGPLAPLVGQYGGLEYVGWTYRRLLAIDGVLDAELLQLAEGPVNPEWDPWSLELGEAAVTPEPLARWAETANALREHQRVADRLAPLLSSYPESVELSRAYMNALFALGDQLGAAEEAGRLARRLPDDVEAAVRHATLLARTDRVDQALGLVDALHAKHPDNYEVRLFRAQVARKEKRLDEARTALEALVREDPDDARALEELSRLCTERGEHLQAGRWMEQVLRRRPWRMQTWMRCIQDHARGGDVPHARELIELVTKLGMDPGFLQAVTTFVDGQEAPEGEPPEDG